MFLDDLRSLNHQYFDLLKNKVESGLINNKSKSIDDKTSPDHKSSKKLTIKDVQEKVKLLLINGKLFEKALKVFSNGNFFFINYYKINILIILFYL